MTNLYSFYNRAQVSNVASTFLSITAGICLLTASSKISISLEPVPITLQPTAVIFLCIISRGFNSFFTVLLWIVLGALGLPVFVGSLSGHIKLLGPTGGYIYSYIITSFFISYIKSSNLRVPCSDIAFSILGVFINILIGTMWLSNFICIKQSFMQGCIPFIVPGIIKSFVLCIALRFFKDASES